MNCRFCNNEIGDSLFIDLGVTPPSNSYITSKELSRSEIAFPLRVFVCNNCWLVQTEDFADASHYFSAEYAYFSSTSTSWCEHAKIYSEMIIDKLALDRKSLVIEIASNDGYLLRNFLEKKYPVSELNQQEALQKHQRVLELMF